MSETLNNFSYSAISTFKNCPRSFEYKYIKKLPEAFLTIETHMGSCVHETLEWVYDQRQQGVEPNLEASLEQFKQFWNRENMDNIKIVKEDKSKDDYYKQGCEFISGFFRRILPFDLSSTLYLEHKFEIPLGDEIKYRGVIDRIAKNPNGIIRITDYKTGKVDHPLSTLQLPSYAVYIFQNNIDPEIELCYEDLKEERTIIVTFSRKEAKKAKEDLSKEIDEILKTKPGAFNTNPSMLCMWCGYNTICDNPHSSVKKTGGNQEEYLEACPLCGSQLQQKKGKFGTFLGCTNYPECRFTRNLGVNERNAAADPNVEGKDVCPECGGLLKQRKGKYGPFLGCANYPECRFTRPLSVS
jgi:hypothetical protein